MHEPNQGVLFQRDRVIYFRDGLYSTGENRVSASDYLQVEFIGYDVVEAHLEDDWVAGRPCRWWDWLAHWGAWLLGKLWHPEKAHVVVLRRSQNE
jgi:hypothetical protein